MLKAIFSLGLVLIVLITAELLHRNHKLKSEGTRKLIHILVASFVATWPFYMSYHYIELISVAFFLVVFVSRNFNVFHSIHKVERKTLGDLFFPVSILFTALLTPSRLVFVVVMLNLGLADGVAALVGSRLGKPKKSSVLSSNKSLVGSLAFWLTALVILLYIKLFPIHLNHLSWTMVIILPIVTSLVENLSPYGTDNLTVPLVVLVALRWL